MVEYYGNKRTFTDYDTANAYVNEVGFPTLMQNALTAVSNVPDGFIAMGFSNGGGMATYIALHRHVAAVVLCSGALPLSMIGAATWPRGVPAQLHYMVDDPRKVDGSVESVMASVNSVNAANADAEYMQYPGSGHLFTDPSQKDEYGAAVTERFWRHVVAFCKQHAS